jgi:hypothetical protein
MGYDRRSLFADPGLIAPERGDFGLKPESPAWKMGIAPVDISTVGLLPDFPKRWRE